MKYIFKRSIFHCYVGLPECIINEFSGNIIFLMFQLAFQGFLKCWIIMANQPAHPQHTYPILSPEVTGFNKYSMALLRDTPWVFHKPWS